MKRIIYFFIAALLVISMSACNSTKQNFQQPVNFYYCTNPESYRSGSEVFLPEIRESAGYNDHISLLNKYLKGPMNGELLSPFPAGVIIEDITLEHNAVNIRLSSQFAKLTGKDLTLACTGLCLTVLDLIQAERVTFSVADRMLDGQNTITLSREDFIFLDSYTDPVNSE